MSAICPLKISMLWDQCCWGRSRFSKVTRASGSQPLRSTLCQSDSWTADAALGAAHERSVALNYLGGGSSRDTISALIAAEPTEIRRLLRAQRDRKRMPSFSLPSDELLLETTIRDSNANTNESAVVSSSRSLTAFFDRGLSPNNDTDVRRLLTVLITSPSGLARPS